MHHHHADSSPPLPSSSSPLFLTTCQTTSTQLEDPNFGLGETGSIRVFSLFPDPPHWKWRADHVRLVP
eukprot:6662713-Pyramimonas_sp.AAC.1